MTADSGKTGLCAAPFLDWLPRQYPVLIEDEES